MTWTMDGGAYALGMGLDLTGQRPRCFRMALMTSLSSMVLLTQKEKYHLGGGFSGHIFTNRAKLALFTRRKLLEVTFM